MNIGERLGRYEILARLGSGGMGVVYRARDSRLERTVAIKLLPPDTTFDEHAKERFLHEARTASALDHVNICTIHEIDETPEGRLYLVMAFYEGETVGQRIARGALGIGEAIDVAMQAGAGLAEAHAANIVHRDVKPANLLVARSGVVKILDFGLAKLAGSGLATRTGLVSGTVAYMSPEQVQGQEIDHRTDIWSLGIVFYEMLAGRRPFGGDNLLALSQAIVHDRAPALLDVRPDLTPDVDRVLARAVSKRPSDRYQHMADMVADLAAAATASGLGVRAPVGLARTGAVESFERPRSSSGSAGARVPPSIAVLPFADMSPQKDQDYFCEGIADELINALAALEGLHVAARTSSFQFKGQGVDVSEIGRRLRVGIILEGSVRKAGNRLRITAQLVKAADGYHLWSERYDRDMDDIFAVQDEIARSVVRQLRVKLLGGSGPLVKRHTSSVDAYHTFLRGRHSRFSLYDLRGAIGHFERAVEQDPTYAVAHAAIADCFNILGLYAVLPPPVAAAKARAAAERALVLDEELAEAYGALAHNRFLFDFNWEEADRLFRRAIELRPGGVEIYCWYGYFLAAMGQVDEGLRHIQHATALDPLSAYVSGYAATILYIGRRFDEAIKRCEDALQIQPGFGLALNTLAIANAALGRDESAVTHAEKLVAVSQRSSHSLSVLGWLLAAAGRSDAARTLLAELEERAREGYVSPLGTAGIWAALGELDHAFAALERAYTQRTATLHSMWFPQYDTLRIDPRWHDLARRLRLPPYQPSLEGEL